MAQERRMDDEQSVMRAVDAATDWLVDKGYMHALLSKVTGVGSP